MSRENVHSDAEFLNLVRAVLGLAPLRHTEHHDKPKAYMQSLPDQIRHWSGDGRTNPNGDPSRR